jgi:biotin transport system substrate-specific component
MSLTNYLVSFSHKITKKILDLHLDYLLLLPLFFFIGSQIIIRIPFSPVPISLQPYTVFLAAWFLGQRGAAGYAMYLLHGACGAPIFAGFSGGLTYLLGPTCGYLIGFLVGAVMIVSLKSYVYNNVQAYSLYVVANIAVFACGIANLTRFMPLQRAVMCGLVPFIIGDFLFKPVFFVLATRLRK